MDQARYEYLHFDQLEHGVLVIEMRLPEGEASASRRIHRELSEVWAEVGADEAVSVAIVTGEGEMFMPPIDPSEILANAGDYELSMGLFEEARHLVLDLVDCDKPIISAVTGPAIGAGLAVALLADISIVGDDVPLTDGHVPVGIAAGDHAVLIWPLLCGMAKAKLYLLTSDSILGADADRLGLVSKSVPADEVLDSALELANRLATGPTHAIRWTKRSLNHWLREAGPAFEASLAEEILGMFGPDHVEAVHALMEDRAPVFTSR